MVTHSAINLETAGRRLAASGTPAKAGAQSMYVRSRRDDDLATANPTRHWPVFNPYVLIKPASLGPSWRQNMPRFSLLSGLQPTRLLMPGSLALLLFLGACGDSSTPTADTATDASSSSSAASGYTLVEEVTAQSGDELV